ncbi:ACP phosphodiesterase [Simiduia curdlanivorans]|uniref:ACP phosphodiesterase n=1 Tax=Simiduia curdlanivorans TaxID=1492769 RepID=A0ABV8V283_9GAMM|nr:ACP phosphodiesterase [Simiduia curdlanivorans]MDN3637888.1 ACP phosphodiesterase [Simiduia curdlanivorans]
MNYLAHLALSGPDPDMQVGGFLGDWLKGPIESHRVHWAKPVLQGVALHRRIDAWVDAQTEIQSALALLGGKHRRIAGPVIDIAFDHYLAKHFSQYHQQLLADFCQRAFTHLNQHEPSMPEQAQLFLRRAQSHRLFERYAERDTYLSVVGSLRRRISKPELLDGIEHQLIKQDQALEAIFHLFYPRLCRQVNELIAGST